MKTLSILAALSLPTGLFACLNSPLTEKSLSGWTSEGHLISNHLAEAENRTSADKRPRLSVRASPQDSAVIAILNGDYPKGIAMLKQNEEKDPGDYNTAANLGTAYELIGDNENALRWIREGIQRNALSHKGTEWLHVVILEAKLATEKGQIRPDTQRLIPLPKTIKKDTVLSVEGGSYTADQVFNALTYQLQERMTFVKPSDRWVAECLFSLAILQAHFYSIRDGITILNMAERYGFPDLAQLKNQRQKLERSLLFGEIQYWTLWILGGAAGIAAIIYCFRKFAGLFSS